MLSSPFTTLKFLSLRDNLIRYKASEAIKDALTLNKSITKLLIDYNPIKRDIMEQIAQLCKRNQDLDVIQQKNKNIVLLKEKKAKANTQRQALKAEIVDLKNITDKTLNQIHDNIQEDGRLNQRSQAGNRSQKSVAMTPYYSHCPSSL